MVLLPELYVCDPSLSNLNLLLTILSPYEKWENIFLASFPTKNLDLISAFIVGNSLSN